MSTNAQKLTQEELERMREALIRAAHHLINEREFFGNWHYQAVKHVTNVFEGIARSHGFSPAEARIHIPSGEIIGGQAPKQDDNKEVKQRE